MPDETYRHFKGTLYEALGRAQCSETGKVLVLYREHGADPHTTPWARPEEMFHEEVKWPDGEMRPRFVKEDPPDED